MGHLVYKARRCYVRIFIRCEPASCVGLLILLAVSIGSRASAHATPAQAVDGSKHPELIPDETMYSLVFLNASVPTASATDLEK